MNRRDAMKGLTALASFAAVQRAFAQQQAAADPMEQLSRLPGLKMMGDEQVALLLYPGFTALDIVGPHYFLASMMGAKVHLVTNQKDLAPVKSDFGFAIEPTIRMADCPLPLTVICIPGGTTGTLAAMQDPATMEFVKNAGKTAQYITSVCTGSMVLAAAGLLKGKKATSHWVAREVLKDFGATPVRSRVVVDGNVITGAGVSAGLDFGLKIVQMLRGKPYAQALRLQAEYAPEPPVSGGTPESTPAEITGPMRTMLDPFVVQARQIAAKL